LRSISYREIAESVLFKGSALKISLINSIPFFLIAQQNIFKKSFIAVCFGCKQIGKDMVKINLTIPVEKVRHFLINSTCRSFMPLSYYKDPEVFPEKESGPGSIYIEAVDKVTLTKIKDITFVNVKDILGIIYVSKSGNTKLKWRQIRGKIGKLTGIASTNSIVNLAEAGILTIEQIKDIAAKQGEVSSLESEVED